MIYQRLAKVFLICSESRKASKATIYHCRVVVAHERSSAAALGY
jgi:hypothetical protein